MSGLLGGQSVVVGGCELVRDAQTQKKVGIN